MENGTKKFCVILFVTLAFFAGTTYGWMFNGRPVGGKVGAPYVPKGVQLPDQQFFEFQAVNHFDGSDLRYWKQVSLICYLTSIYSLI